MHWTRQNRLSAWSIPMEKIVKSGQLIFGIAIAAFGVENFICAHLGLTVRGVPWFPGNPVFGYLTGIAMLAAGLSIVASVRARLTAILLGILFLFYVLVAQMPLVIVQPMGLSVRTVFFEALALGSSSLTLAATLPPGDRGSQWNNVLDKLIKSGPYLFRNFVDGFWHYSFSCSRLYRQFGAGLASRAHVLGLFDRDGFRRRRDQHRDSMDGSMGGVHVGDNVCALVLDSPLA
jgi:putative oxidoreductase